MRLQMRLPVVGFALLSAVSLAAPACASPGDLASPVIPGCAVDDPRPGPWAVDFGTPASARLSAHARLDVLAFDLAAAQAAQPVRRAAPIEYSDGYRMRARIHKYASVATLPLFVANYVVGQKLYQNHDGSMRGAHVGLATGTAALFGVNSVTGVWNLWEGRKDPNNRARRMTHGVLMLVADAGFFATAMLAPEGEHREHAGAVPGTSSGASTHRAVAVSSMGIATVSYLIMLLGGH